MRHLQGRWSWLVVALALIPSAWIVWRFQAMPQIGAYHDDAIYLETAQSLAETGTYRMESLPERPFQTKYPPLWPWLLSIYWRVNPNFPSNLPGFLWLCWTTLVLYIVATFLILRAWSGNSGLAAGLTALAAVSPHIVLAGTMTMAELIFSALVMASILLLESGMDRSNTLRPRLHIFILAGAAGALAFLTRTQAIVLLISAGWILVARKMWREAFAFSAIFSTAVVGWAWWTHSHAYQGSDPTTIYYLDYIRFYRSEVYLRDLPVMMQMNVDSICSATLGLLMAPTSRGLWIRMFAWVIAIGTVSGLVRLTKETRRYHFVGYSLASCLMLVVWHWPPNERYLIPLLPAILLGFYREVVHLTKLCWQNLHGAVLQKAVASVLLVCALSSCIASGWGNLQGTLSTLPSIYQEFEKNSNSRTDGYKWIRANTSPDAQFLSYDDPLLYLYTGRRGYAMPILYWLTYGGTLKRFDAYFKTADLFMTEHGLDYVFYTISDFRRDLTIDGQRAFLKEMANTENFSQEFQSPGSSVFRLKSESRQHAETPRWWTLVRDKISMIE